MKEYFPPVDAVTRTWINVVERNGSVRTDVLATLVDAHIRADELVVAAHICIYGVRLD
jgi:hypothetical protein